MSSGPAPTLLGIDRSNGDGDPISGSVDGTEGSFVVAEQYIPPAPDDAATPLLLRGRWFVGYNSASNSKYMDNPDFVEDYDGYESDQITTRSIFERARKFSRRRFWWFCLLGIIFLIIFELSFLPRTSLARDFRRWYKLPLTKADISRDYLVFSGIGRLCDATNITNEQALMNRLGNFTKLNSKSSVNVCAADNYELVSYVESSFRKLIGFRTKSYSYEVSGILAPVSSSLRLVDDKDNVLYDAKLTEAKFKTPAFYLRNTSTSAGGKVSGGYLFVNEGKREDYQLLLKDKIDLQGKIVLVKEGKLKLSVSERISIGKQFGISGFIMYSDPLAQAQNENENNTREQNQVEASIHRDVIETLEDDEIVSIPISYKSILPILNTLGKPKRSGLFQNWTYNPTVSSTTLFLDLETSFDTNLDTRKVTNIISTMDGILQDGEVVIGCSRDSLTSTNPLSGHAIMFEIMENFQRLTKLGWKPLRPIKFVSWDGTHSGLSGSKLYLNDPHAYNSNMPVVAYINIDGDGVMGSHFQVDGHPTLNHILKKVSKYVPIPKKSIYFKTLLNDDNELMGEEDKEEEEDIDVSSSTSGTTSLYRYWKKQDNNTINPYLGDLIKLTDAINFQQHLGVPIVNAKFSNDPRRDTLIYTPNSNFYSYDWLIDRDIDNDMILHGLLVRFLGLLTISFVENEVSDRRIFPYIKQIQTFFLNVTYSGESEQKLWLHKEIPLFLINKADIYTDIEPAPLPDKKIGFVDLIVQFNILIDNLISQSKIYDEYNSQVEKNLMKDYAWYHLLMKVKHYAQFKVANYKLLRLEQELMVNRLEDFKYLYSNFTCQEPWFNHIIYGLSKFDASATNSSIYEHRDENSVFPGFQDSFREQDFDQSVRWLVISYSKLKGLYKKMT